MGDPRLQKLLTEIAKLPSLGQTGALEIFEKLDITTLGELEYACKENRLLRIDGFGEEKQSQVLKDIQSLRRHESTFLYFNASLEAQILLSAFRSMPEVSKAEIAGSLRRKMEIVRNIDVVVAALDKNAVIEKTSTHPSIESVIEKKENHFSAFLKSGMPLELRLVSDSEFAGALLYYTGNKEHNVSLEKEAAEKGLELNPKGLFTDGKNTGCRTEEEIYKKIGLDFIPPELRENQGELEAAAQHRLPALIETGQIRGIFHCHTVDSDGTNTLEEMIAAAEKIGYEYIGISEHSASADPCANGLKKKRVLEQFKRIDALQKKFKIRILKGIESDILPDGSLDYDKALLKKFDFVIGSIHTGYEMPEEEMTQRALKAIRNPYMDFLGHPTGRLLLAREGARFKMREILDEAARQEVIVEINANPQRLDLDWRFGPYAMSKGLKFSINPDAHSIAALSDVDYGVGIARKGWIKPESVINTLPVDQALSFLRRHKL